MKPQVLSRIHVNPDPQRPWVVSSLGCRVFFVSVPQPFLVGWQAIIADPSFCSGFRLVFQLKPTRVESRPGSWNLDSPCPNLDRKPPHSEPQTSNSSNQSQVQLTKSSERPHWHGRGIAGLSEMENVAVFDRHISTSTV